VPFDEPSSGISEDIDNAETAWFKVIRENANIDLHRLSGKFNQKLSDDKLELSKTDETMLTLLKDVSSIMLSPSSTNEPFQPVLVMADGRRSAMPCDLTANDLELLSTAIVDISHIELKARVNDLLWLCSKPRNPDHARNAIDGYIPSSINPKKWYEEVDKKLERAYKLACSLKDEQRKLGVENLLKDAFYCDDNEFRDIAISVTELIDKLNLFKHNFFIFAVRLEQLGEQFFTNKDYLSAVYFFELSAKKYRQYKDEEKAVFVLLRAAESYESKAEKQFNTGKGARLISSSSYEETIHAYRRIPAKFRVQYSVDSKLSALRHKLNEAGRNTLEHMRPVKTPIDNADELIAYSEQWVTGKSSLFEALVHLYGLVGLSKYEELKESEKENMSKSFVDSLFGVNQYSGDGRVVEKSPAIGFDNDEKKYNQALDTQMIQSFDRCLSFNVNMCIYPALDIILNEHHLSHDFIFQMCNSSPIVPKENINLICHAIWLGFEYDFDTAIHLVAPQVEKIVRMQLKQNNVHTTNIDKNGIEHENGLSTLLDMDEARALLGEDLLFELRAVFTSSHGANLRNEVAHGILTDGGAFSSAPIYGWWILVRMIIHSLIKAARENELSE
jgi:hypothetical protein